MTLTRRQLTQVLSTIQNSAEFEHADIMTFSGFMTTLDELADYVLAQFSRLSLKDKARVVARTGEIIMREAA